MGDSLAANVTAGNLTIPFTIQEQVIAYSALYLMALFCIILGSFRSLKFVKQHIVKNKKLEVSITTSEAKKFPITASFVLFMFYLIFKINENGIDYFIIKTKPFLSQISPTAADQTEQFVINYIKPLNLSINGTASNHTSILKKIASYNSYLEKGISHLPEANIKDFVFLFLIILCAQGCFALSIILQPIFSFFLSHLPIGDRFPRRNTFYTLSLQCSTEDSNEIKEKSSKNASSPEFLIHSEFNTHLIISFFICSSVGILYLNTRHWITNNLLGIAFSIYGIENLHLASFKAGTILLTGLFIYDIFWVFATDVMTTVAKGIDAPILLIFPQDLLRNGFFNATKHGMLGLGDIVIPGIYIALLYRFDHYIGTSKNNSKNNTIVKNRYYCWITIFAYAIGLLITMGVMHYFKAAQPALLYLVPTCLFTPLFIALICGEFKALWNYSEEHFIKIDDDNNTKTSEVTKKKKTKTK